MATAATQAEANDLNLISPPNGPAQNAAAPVADGDHPQGDEIRRQVEFYFSDENLPTDLHLLQCCGGRKNDPVSISRICGFRKMRSYKPRTRVVAALRKSTFLQVSTDGKTIKRRIPLQGKCVLDPDFFGDDGDVAYDLRDCKPAVYPVPQLPQKKAEYPKGMSKNMMKPTGFEASYLEAPVRPEEAAEEEAMYDADKPFVERIEMAIQRFKQNRRMHAMYAVVFNKLMRFGGVESGPRMYQGLSKAEMEKMDSEEIARALATHNVPWDRADEKKWVVDFEALAKAFLSSWYPAHYGYAPDAIENACKVPRSFYNYLRYHKVCPEYDDQLAKALAVCDIAEQELPKVHAAGLALPGKYHISWTEIKLTGDFNKSASVIFTGAHAGVYTGDQSWADDMRAEGLQMKETGLRGEEARINFATGVAIIGTDEQCDKLEAGDLRVLKRVSAGLNVVEIHVPTDLTKEAYEVQSKAVENKLGQLEPLGKLICKTWYVEDCDEWDLPKHKYPGEKPKQASACRVYELWVEGSVLQECFLGMKLEAKILELDGGITILDEVHETMCSFFTWLPNELWMERKPKEVRWLKKGLANDEEEDGDGDEVGGQEFDDE
ncbi:Argonaute siRNA chaperone complex subunit Arb1-domain-containing protein [Phaeosphaeria sp. MPI-PUGE-AT-0046c]|nr:Argonaute siRNA chaperone complex subunit Arb1-domain-containing protein [Phaeosphaeria sp. MPI-PUGE-AT-0046c]